MKFAIFLPWLHYPLNCTSVFFKLGLFAQIPIQPKRLIVFLLLDDPTYMCSLQDIQILGLKVDFPIFPFSKLDTLMLKGCQTVLD